MTRPRRRAVPGTRATARRPPRTSTAPATGAPTARGGAGGYPPAQYPPPGGPPTDVIADLDGDGQPESSVTVADADGVVDEEDVSAVVGDVFFVYAADDSTIPANDGGTPTAVPTGKSDDISSVMGVNEGGGETDGRTKSEGEGEELGQGGRDHGGESDARDSTDDPDGETVADAERALSGGTGSGPGRVVIFAIGAGTLLVANGLLARWIVG